MFILCTYSFLCSKTTKELILKKEENDRKE